MKRFFYLFTIIAAIGIVVLIGYFIRYRSETEKSILEEDVFTSPQAGLPSVSLPSKSPAEKETSSLATSFSATSTQNSTSSALVIIPPGSTPFYKQFLAVAENPIADYAIDENNNVSFIQPDGQIVKIVNKKAVVLSSATIANLRQASFSPDAQKVAVIFGDLQNLQANVFDLTNQVWQPLPQGITSIAWSPDSQKIAYLIKQLGQTVLTILEIGDPKNKPQEVLKLYAEDLVLNWPAKNLIILHGKSSALVESSVWKFDIEKKSLSLVVDREKGLETLYEPLTDTELIFSVNQNRDGVLSLKEGNKITRTLSFLTLPSKCIFRVEKQTESQTNNQSKDVFKSYLICAVPQKDRGWKLASLPDDYYKKVVFASDEFFYIPLETGEIIYLSTPEMLGKNLDAQNLKISNNQLFFINRFDQKLYVLPLSTQTP